MSVVTFTNNNLMETGQTLGSAVIACSFAFEHNYRILLIATDYNDNSLENCFFNAYRKQRTGSIMQSMGMSRLSSDISGGMEGLVRMFASNRATTELVKSFARPVLKDRLDILPAPKTRDFKEYQNMSVYFSQIANVAEKAYDLVLVDLSNQINDEYRLKMFDVSTVIVVGLTQTMWSIDNFSKMKTKEEMYNKNSVLLNINKYNANSKFTDKNIGRMLSEKYTPSVVPYNILFSDSCSEGQIIDYVLGVRQLSFKEGKDGYFYDKVKEAADKIDYRRKEIVYGRN